MFQVGKAGVCGQLNKTHGYENLVSFCFFFAFFLIAREQERGEYAQVMIGDGATDMEACPPADAFIGFGGNAVSFPAHRSPD